MFLHENFFDTTRPKWKAPNIIASITKARKPIWKAPNIIVGEFRRLGGGGAGDNEGISEECRSSRIKIQKGKDKLAKARLGYTCLG